MNDWRAFPVEALLPHAGKMVLLERVLEFSEETLTAEVIVRNDGLFGDGYQVPAWLGIEYMAQTIAALGGMKRRLAGKSIELGFLLGTRRYHCNVDSFKVGAVLNVAVKHLIQDQGLGVFDCHIRGDGVEVSAKLSVYQPDSAVNRVISMDQEHYE
ncbi:MAG: hotdog family protein [Methylomicrobium sp.]